MSIDTIKRQSRLTEESAETNNSNMVTIDRIKAENFLLILENCIGDIEEQRNLVDELVADKNAEMQKFQSETIIKFNELIDATSDLKERIKASESYENYLQEKAENGKLLQEVAMLEQQLQKEKAEISSFIIRTDNFITLKIGEIQSKVNELRTENETFEKQVMNFKDDLKNEMIKYTSDVDRQLEEVSASFENGYKNQSECLKADCSRMLKAYTEKCLQNLETVQKQSVDFLKQCSAENRKLIEKVPSVADKKLSIKDILICSVSAVAVLSVFFQFLFR